MRTTTLSRRALGLLTAGTIGMCSVVLGATGVASAEDDAVITESTETVTVAEEEEEVLAAAPAAPYLNYAEGIDGGLDLDFVDESSGPDAATSFEASTDSGSTWQALTDIEVSDGRTYGTLGGLTNGTSYTVVVRAVNSSGSSAASNSTTGVPYLPIGAPTGVTATRSTTGVSVTWGDPASAGTFALAGWTVGYSTGESADEGCTVGPAVRTCSFALPTGADYAIAVLAIDDEEFPGDPTFLQSGAVAAPAVPTAVPTRDDGDITGPAGAISTLTAGQQVVLQGSGYLPGSTVQLTVFSSPVNLGSVLVASDGTFTATVTVPAGLSNGTHTLVATGVAPDGSTRNLIVTVTVSGGVATLANTGFETGTPLAAGGLALLVGAGLLVGARRRTTV